MSGADDECIHGLGPVSACVLCNGRAERDRAAEIAAGEAAWRTFPASYEGHCRACYLPIFVGEMIAWRPDAPATHADCQED